MWLPRTGGGQWSDNAKSGLSVTSWNSFQPELIGLHVVSHWLPEQFHPQLSSPLSTLLRPPLQWPAPLMDFLRLLFCVPPTSFFPLACVHMPASTRIAPEPSPIQLLLSFFPSAWPQSSVSVRTWSECRMSPCVPVLGHLVPRWGLF